jgi:hypothetical protein
MAEIEYVLLANHAEAVAGLLYVSGGSWTDQWRGRRPPGAPTPPTHFGIGVSVLIPWNDTNRPHHLVIRIEGEDGGGELARAEADLEAGRPPGLARGVDQRAVLALNVDMAFPQPGGYRVVAEMRDQVKTVSFRVHDEPLPQARQ